ncbi:MAG: hypothetical protein FH753_00980 [Firmicutes bacterium]|nr:hypothetical protein [Bacillota bacterium]
MTNRLRNRLELWGMVEFENELDEIDREEQKIKDIYCNILPRHGEVNEFDNTNIEYVRTLQTIIVRKKSIDNPQIDMFFKDNKGKKYEVIDFFEDYKNRQFWEFKTKIVYE